MKQEELAHRLTKHSAWLDNKEGGEQADLSGADLRGAALRCADLRWADLEEADLSGADLSGADLSEVDLSGADLSGADLSGADLSGADLRSANLWIAHLGRADLRGADLRQADLSGADLRGANLRAANLHAAIIDERTTKIDDEWRLVWEIVNQGAQGRDLRGADLRWADLEEADLSGADLEEADLYEANLRGANLHGANLHGANLSRTNLSEVDGLLSPQQWLSQFETTSKGIIVYKRIGDTRFLIPDYWTIKEGGFLEETVNPLPTLDCACGVNFGTLEWCKKNYTAASLWKCLIWAPFDTASIVVPYNTDGKARCGRLQLLEKIEE